VAPAGTSRDHGVLFARAYLDSKLAKLKEDQQQYLLETVKEWFDKMDDSSLKAYVASFIGPVLDVLGHIRSELGKNLLSLYSDRSHQKAVALCYVVGPHESLDQTSKGRNYAVSLIIALRKIGLKWGILTNGLLWRVYCVKEKAPFETYFQVDLGEALRTRDSKEIFLLAEFFSAAAFLPSETGKCPLDDNRYESDEETREIEKHLESKIESILGKICMGFIESEGRKSYTEDEKRVVFSNSIYLLYRILFVLYAEARGFLPLQDPDYNEKSMARLTEIAKENHSKGIANPNGRTMWNVLHEVFNWVNQGNRAMGIPPYNGGLFDDSEKTYLANHVINDAFLSEALFSLGFREERGNIVPINYNDLSVRHLGGLYEGILEYQLFIAPERMVRRKEENIYKFIPESRAGKITRMDTVIERGNIYFSQSSEERKLTGSYYTPEDVVRYIVENSLGQYLVGIDNELKELVRKLKEAQSTAVDERERGRIEKFIDSEVLSFLEKKVLSIKVLDPAMGSGHFLVNVSHFLTNYIIESLHSTEWENDSVDTSPLLWRRRVVEKCVFGVDLNELATELAKLSLWLITADNRKPLTFLDHHLRTGNSLLGADLEYLGALPANGKFKNSEKFQTTLYYPVFRKEFIPRVLHEFGKMQLSSEEIEDVEMKKVIFKEWEKLKRDVQGVADTWLATFFGYQIEEERYQSLLSRAIEGREVSVDKRVEEISRSPKNRFFHWWLEFPEVFFKSGENDNGGGFNVVIGNPPYVAFTQIEQIYVDYYSKNFKTAGNRLNTFSLFIEKSIDLLRESGFFGMIVPKNSIRSNAYVKLRKFVLDNCNIMKIIPLGAGIFEGVTGEVVIPIFQKSKDSFARQNNMVLHAGKEVILFGDYKTYQKLPQRIFYEIPGNRFNVYLNDEKIRVLEKIKARCVELKEVAYTRNGIIVGDERRYIKKAQGSEQYKPILRGRDISRYLLKFNNEYLFYVPRAKVLQRAREPDLFERDEKILTQHVSSKIIAALDTDGYYALQTINLVFSKGEISNYYLLALLNSKLINFYYDCYFNMSSEFTTAVATQNLDVLPVKIIPDSAQRPLIELVEKMIFLNKRFNELNDKKNAERIEIEEEIKKTDAEIDDLVYDIYGITEAERHIVEGGLK